MDNLAEQWTPDSGEEAVAGLSATAAAAALGVSQRTIRRAIARGDLPATKSAGVYRIAPADLGRYDSSRLSSGPPAGQGRRESAGSVPVPVPLAHAIPDPIRPLSSLIGRQVESIALRDLLLLPDVPLVTLTGPGGVGKTRLALQVLTDLRTGGVFPDGAWFVELAPLPGPELVVAAIAHTFGIREVRGRSPLDGLRAHLRDKDLLLVLDNFEHLLPAAADLAALLAACPGLKVLVTSRILLRISGERDFPVSPLSLPDPERRVSPDELDEADAVRLFVERARSVRSDFELTAANAEAVAAICRRLDGLPLAIELAAARSNVLPPPALLARLDRRLPLLTGGSRDAPPRLRAMRNAIAWSYDLLSADEQATFRRLAVFAGGFTLEAAEAVSHAVIGSETGVLTALSSLVDGSLLHRRADPEEELDADALRFGMLETVREFALERQAASGEREAIRAAHAAFFLELAERAAPQLGGPGVRVAAARLGWEHANLRAALAWFAAVNDGASLLRLARALGSFWEVTGHWTEGIFWLECSLEADPRPSPVRVAALEVLGLIYGYCGDDVRAESVLREALDLARCIGTTERIGTVLVTLASLFVDRRRYTDAEPLLAEAVALERRLGDSDREAFALTQAGIAAWGRGDRAEATARIERAHAIWRELDRPVLVRTAAFYQANAAAEAGDFARAADIYRQFLTHVPDSSAFLARILPDVASLAVALGEPERAVRLFGAGAALAETIGLVPAWPEREIYERATATARRVLGGDAFEAALEAGTRLSREQLWIEVTMALDAVATASATGHRAASPDRHGLTVREQEVLRLVAERLTDKEIAERLFISRRTASKHVAAILAKLGVPDRRAAGAEATLRGLI